MSLLKSVSLVIRSYGVENVPEILLAIDNQHTHDLSLIEIIIINGMDGFTWPVVPSLKSCSRVIVTNIPNNEYSPGKALNKGMSFCSGDFVVFLSGHTIPIGTQWLMELLQPFSDKGISCVSGSQTPFSDSNFLERTYRRLWYQSELIAEIFAHCNFANAAVNRKLWESIRFNENVAGCEDRVWVRAVRSFCGSKSVFNKKANVYHSHRYNILKTIRYFIWLFFVNAQCFLMVNK